MGSCLMPHGMELNFCITIRFYNIKVLNFGALKRKKIYFRLFSFAKLLITKYLTSNKFGSLNRFDAFTFSHDQIMFFESP